MVPHTYWRSAGRKRFITPLRHLPASEKFQAVPFWRAPATPSGPPPRQSGDQDTSRRRGVLIRGISCDGRDARDRPGGPPRIRSRGARRAEEEECLAFWINTYNALVVEGILDLEIRKTVPRRSQ